MSATMKTTIIKEQYEVADINFKIKNFTEDLRDIIIESYVITFGSGPNSSQWLLRIYPNNPKLDPNYVGVYLIKESTGKFDVDYRFILYDAKKHIIKNSKSDGTRSYKYQAEDSWGFPKFIARNLLFQKITPDFVFNISFEIKVYCNNDQLQVPDVKVSRENFSDLKIQVEEVTLDAHKFIIAAHSPILHQEILKIKKPSRSLSITEFGAETISTILTFMYKKEYQLTFGNVQQILLASKKYQIVALQKRCQDFMSDDLDLENALETLEFSDRNGLKDLFSSSLKFATDKIRELIKSESWNNFILCHKVTFKKLFESVLANSKLRLTQNPFITNQQIDTLQAHSSRTQNDFGNLLTTSSFSDFEILVEGKILKAHKLILSCRSKVFEVMFKHDTRENKENRMEIPDLSYQTVKELLNYMYTGTIADLKKNAVNLYEAADKYDLPELRDICKNEMIRNMTVDNVLEFLKMADLYDLGNLKSKVVSFIYKNHKELFSKREWTDFAVENPKILDELLENF